MSKKKKSLKGVKRQKELWYSELRGSLLNHNKYVLSEHIFINIIIKLTLKRYCKYRKENEYRERKTHQNKPKKRHLWIFSSSDNNVRSKPESNIRYSTDRKGSETKKTAIFTALQHPHSKVPPPPHVLPHNGTQTRNCTWEMTLYIKKTTSSSVKTAISFKQIESPLLLFKIIQSAISHQQREPVIKIVIFFFLVFKIFVFSQQWLKSVCFRDLRVI